MAAHVSGFPELGDYHRDGERHDPETQPRRHSNLEAPTGPSQGRPHDDNKMKEHMEHKERRASRVTDVNTNLCFSRQKFEENVF